VMAQVVLSIMLLMYNKIAHLDLHSDNIIITSTRDKDFTLTIGNRRYTLPTNGYSIKIIDYDIVGLILGGSLYKSSEIPIKQYVTVSNKSITEMPGYFMLSMLSRILFDETTPVKIIKDNPIIKLIGAVEGRKSISHDVSKLSQAVHLHGYTVANYNTAYGEIYNNAEKMISDIIDIDIVTI
jgi:hypothetical protein